MPILKYTHAPTSELRYKSFYALMSDYSGSRTISSRAIAPIKASFISRFNGLTNASDPDFYVNLSMSLGIGWDRQSKSIAFTTHFTWDMPIQDRGLFYYIYNTAGTSTSYDPNSRYAYKFNSEELSHLFNCPGINRLSSHALYFTNMSDVIKLKNSNNVYEQTIGLAWDRLFRCMNLQQITEMFIKSNTNYDIPRAPDEPPAFNSTSSDAETIHWLKQTGITVVPRTVEVKEKPKKVIKEQPLPNGYYDYVENKIRQQLKTFYKK